MLRSQIIEDVECYGVRMLRMRNVTDVR